MVLSDLPEELVLYIADFLDTEKDVLAFAQLNRHFQNTLISYLCRRNAKNSGASALLWAAENDQESTAQQALANGATVSATNRRGETPLHLATQAGHLSMTRFLLNVQGVDVNCQNKYHQTPLTAPARDGHEALVELLLHQPGIEPDVSERIRIRPRVNGQTPLSYAAMNGHVNIVRALLATGRVNVESRDTRD
ncbi:hypothetical protein SI65_03360 [Aspergillus cristatus]|uniref:Uncharacterized protein n=1 Tax=Aspergillus cristatus TaxID=573508 RepID=A0A1E3BHB8_ASPCR|nr:hypothetical protein SI65_03360 [Aspergillus cristatus]